MSGDSMAGSEELDLRDLFEPVVTPDLDLAAFDRPYRPLSLTFVVFFSGALFGGLLMAFNWRRLGRPRAVLPTAIAFVVVFVATTAAHLYFYDQLRGKPELGSVVRFGQQVVALAPALAILSAQTKRYEVWERSCGDETKAFGIGVVLVLLNILTLAAIGFALRSWF